MLKKRHKYAPLLFTIYESEIIVSKIKAKDRISLSGSIIDVLDKPSSGFSDHKQFKFRVLVPLGPKSILQGGKYNEHVFGCSSEQLRKEWLFV